MIKYKNVYTILEKVKKGEIKSHYKDQDGLFGKLNFYKKPDLIKPYVHYIDQEHIDDIISQYIDQDDNIKKEFELLSKTSEFKKLGADKKPNLPHFINTLRSNFRHIPEHLKYDVFKLYYHKMDRLEFSERTDANKTQYKFLEHANNPAGKIMTEGSNLKSSIFARNTILHYLLRLTELDYLDPNASEEIKKSLNGSNEFDNNEDLMNQMFEDKSSKKTMERLMQEAQETCKMLDGALDEETQEQLFDQANKQNGDGMVGKMDTDFIRTITAKVSRIKLSMGTLKDKLKKLLDKSVSYFSTKKTTVHEDLFNSDHIAGLEDFVLLHPKLRKIFAEDLTVKDTKSIGKIDIYIDISGSMCSGCDVKDSEGEELTKMEFAKALAVKMKEMDLLNDVYLFDNKVKKWRSDVISIAMIDGNGGTSINRVIESIQSKESNAIILTDAEDHCGLYTDKAFFIGVKGADFRHFSETVISQYAANHQVVVFDGNRTYSVDQTGNTIK